MALQKTFPLPGGYTAEYIKIAEYQHQKEVKRSEAILSVWKDKATRDAAIAGDADAKPTQVRVRVLIEGASQFDSIFPTGEFDETAIYDAIKSGAVVCHTWFGSDLASTPAAQRMLYGAVDV